MTDTLSAKTVAADQFLERHHRARQGGDHGDALCNLPRRHQRGFANADDGKRAADRGRIEPGVVEAGDDAGVGIRHAPERLDQAGNRKGFVIKPSIEAGPIADVTAKISVPTAATARAAAPMVSVMDAVVFGLTIRILVMSAW